MDKRIQGYLLFIAVWTGIILFCMMASNNSEIQAGKIIGLLAFPFVVFGADYLYYINNKEKCKKEEEERKAREEMIQGIQEIKQNMDELDELKKDKQLLDEIHERCKNGENILKNKELRNRIEARSGRCPEIDALNKELKWIDNQQKRQ